MGLSAVLSAAGGLLRLLAGRVPPWAWVLAALAAWGAFQKHAAEAAKEREKAAAVRQEADRAAALQAGLVELARRNAEQGRAVVEATEMARRARADAAAAGAAERRMLERAAAAAAAQRADPAAAGASAPAADAAGVSADVLGRCSERVRFLAELADERGRAGATCERAYDALTLKP
jgi:hypothetical protein